MYLTEILKDINLSYFIDLEDPESLSRTYKINDEKEIQGSECIGETIAETIGRGFNIGIEKVTDISGAKSKFTEGPEKYIKINYKVKIINEIAFKYKVYTKNATLTLFDTWEGFLKPNIFYSILNNANAINKLHNFELNEFIPEWEKTNPDQTVTSYKYAFYPSEESGWANPQRLQFVKFNNGYIELEIEMPVKEVKTIPKEKEIPDETF